ncbi:hypothetical protein, partial [Bilophila wadsworthia]
EGETFFRKFPLPLPKPHPILFKDFRRYRIPVRRDFRVGRKRGLVGVLGKEDRIFLDGKGRRGKAKQQRLASRCFFP